MYMRDIDIENTKKLTGIGDIEIFENPNELLDFLKDYQMNSISSPFFNLFFILFSSNSIM